MHSPVNASEARVADEVQPDRADLEMVREGRVEGRLAPATPQRRSSTDSVAGARRGGLTERGFRVTSAAVAAAKPSPVSGSNA